MSIRQEVILLFKSFDVETTDSLIFSEQLCEILNTGLERKLTVGQVFRSFKPSEPTIDKFLTRLIGGTALKDYNFGLEIGRMVKKEFPHFFSGNRYNDRSGSC